MVQIIITIDVTKKKEKKSEEKLRRENESRKVEAKLRN